VQVRWQVFTAVKPNPGVNTQKVTYTWATLKGATKPTLKVNGSLVGRKLRVVISGSGKTYVSAATKPVKKTATAKR
jgi:hypothetical protein